MLLSAVKLLRGVGAKRLYGGSSCSGQAEARPGVTVFLSGVALAVQSQQHHFRAPSTASSTGV